MAQQIDRVEFMRPGQHLTCSNCLQGCQYHTRSRIYESQRCVGHIAIAAHCYAHDDGRHRQDAIDGKVFTHHHGHDNGHCRDKRSQHLIEVHRHVP